MPWSGGSFTRDNGPQTGSACWADSRSAGTKITAAEHDAHDQDIADGLSFCLNKDGTTTPTAHLSYLRTQVFVSSTGGTANAQTVTLSPAPAAYYAGMRINGKASATNTGALTINVNGLGAKTVKRMGGGACVGSEFIDGMPFDVIYDGTDFLILHNVSACPFGPFHHASGLGAIAASVTAFMEFGSYDSSIGVAKKAPILGSRTVVGMSVSMKASVSAGSCTLTLYKNGSTTSQSVVLTTGSRKSSPITPVQLVNDDYVQIQLATSSGWVSFDSGDGIGDAIQGVLWMI